MMDTGSHSFFSVTSSSLSRPSTLAHRRGSACSPAPCREPRCRELAPPPPRARPAAAVRPPRCRRELAPPPREATPTRRARIAAATRSPRCRRDEVTTSAPRLPSSDAPPQSCSATSQSGGVRRASRSSVPGHQGGKARAGGQAQAPRRRPRASSGLLVPVRPSPV